MKFTIPLLIAGLGKYFLSYQSGADSDSVVTRRFYPLQPLRTLSML